MCHFYNYLVGIMPRLLDTGNTKSFTHKVRHALGCTGKHYGSQALHWSVLGVVT